MDEADLWVLRGEALKHEGQHSDGVDKSARKRVVSWLGEVQVRLEQVVFFPPTEGVRVLTTCGLGEALRSGRRRCVARIRE